MTNLVIKPNYQVGDLVILTDYEGDYASYNGIVMTITALPQGSDQHYVLESKGACLEAESKNFRMKINDDSLKEHHESHNAALYTVSEENSEFNSYSEFEMARAIIDNGSTCTIVTRHEMFVPGTMKACVANVGTSQKRSEPMRSEWYGTIVLGGKQIPNCLYMPDADRTLISKGHLLREGIFVQELPDKATFKDVATDEIYLTVDQYTTDTGTTHVPVGNIWRVPDVYFTFHPQPERKIGELNQSSLKAISVPLQTLHDRAGHTNVQRLQILRRIDSGRDPCVKAQANCECISCSVAKHKRGTAPRSALLKPTDPLESVGKN